MKLSRNLIAVLTLLISTFNLHAGEKVDQELNADANGVVEIENVRGKVAVIGWDKNKVSVKGELDDQAQKFIFTNDGKVTQIKVELPKKVRRGDGSKLTIKVPFGSEVNFNGVSTTVAVKEVNGGARIATVSGDVDLAQIKRMVKVNSVSGNIRVKQGQGQLSASTVSGNIDAEFDTTQAELETVSGDIKLNTAKAVESLKVNTVSGSARLQCGLAKQGDVKLSSVSGNISLKLRGEVDARFNFTTAPGGEISNRLTSDKPKRSFISSQDLRFIKGEGSALVKGNTVSGELTVENSAK